MCSPALTIDQVRRCFSMFYVLCSIYYNIRLPFSFHLSVRCSGAALGLWGNPQGLPAPLRYSLRSSLPLTFQRCSGVAIDQWGNPHGPPAPLHLLLATPLSIIYRSHLFLKARVFARVRSWLVAPFLFLHRAPFSPHKGALLLPWIYFVYSEYFHYSFMSNR